ncbi:hypothetical protein [Leclercia sp.]
MASADHRRLYRRTERLRPAPP